MTAHSYAHEIEEIFAKYHPSRPVTASEFEHRPAEMLGIILGYLHAERLIEEADIPFFMECYNFGTDNLNAYLSRGDGKEKIEELIEQLKAILNKTREK